MSWLSDWCRISQTACRENEWENISGIKGDENDETLVSLRFYLTQLFLCCSPTETPQDLFWTAFFLNVWETRSSSPSRTQCCVLSWSSLPGSLLSALCSLLSGSGPIPVLSVSDWERTPAFYWILVKSWCHLICCLRDKRKRCSPKTRKQVVWYKRNGTPAHGKPSPGSKWDAFQWEIMIICKANAFNVWRIRDSVRFKNGSP